MRILVVEDNDLVADAITLGLSAAGFAVDRSSSAEAADSALATEHFDLLVVDVGLPGQDGLSRRDAAGADPDGPRYAGHQGRGTESRCR
jgi:DNA-binding response OmpR family regulator